MKKKSPPSITQTMTNSPGGIQAGRDVIINPLERKLTEDQRALFLTAARSSPVEKGFIDVEVPMGDSEAYRFAAQLDGILKEAGWETGGVVQCGYDHGIPMGLFMLARDKDHVPASADLLHYAFSQIGLKFEAVLRGDVRPGNIHLIVGARPGGQ